MFFNLKTSKDIEEIKHKFNFLCATEKHVPYAVFDSFDDYRIGLHTYVNGNIVKGYYESGNMSDGQILWKDKAWFYGKITEKNGVCRFRGMCFFSPKATIIYIIAIMECIKGSHPILFLMTLIFCYSGYKEVIEAYECIKEIMSY